jgi:hypothetical protein
MGLRKRLLSKRLKGLNNKLEVFRSRLSKDVFREIYKDVCKASSQYGRMEHHSNEETRSRYIALVSRTKFLIRSNLTHLQFFSEVVALFRCAIVNNPKGLLDAEFTKKGRIVYHFCSMNSISIVFIEVKKTYAMGEGRLDVIAQVLAECAGMSDFSIFWFDDAANNISLRLSKLETWTLGAYSCYPLRWREVRISGLRLCHQIRLRVPGGYRRVRPIRPYGARGTIIVNG